MDNEIINDVENIDNIDNTENDVENIDNTETRYFLLEPKPSSDSSGKILAGVVGAGVALVGTFAYHKLRPYAVALRETRREKKAAKKAAKESSEE